MRLALLLAILIHNAACGEYKPVRVAGFEEEVNAFMVEATNRGKTYDISGLVIELVESPDANKPSIIGMCYFGSRRIVIKQSYWEKVGPLEREALIFHELGHCIQEKQGHSSCPNIMCPTLTFDFVVAYSSKRKQFLDEFFN